MARRGRAGGSPRAPRRRPPASSPGHAGERVGAAVVVGVGVDVEQARAERVRDPIDRPTVASLGHVWDREQRGHARVLIEHVAAAVEHRLAVRPRGWRRAPRRRGGSAPTRCHRSRRSPRTRRAAVPRIFSSSSTLPVSLARSLVPTPSSARLVPSSPCARSSSMNWGPSPSSGRDDAGPPPTVSLAGSTLIPSGARLEATIVPSPLSGAMNPSPQGRLPNAPGAAQVTVVGDPGAAGQLELKSVPRGQVTRAARRGVEQRRDRARSRAPSCRSRPPSRARACPR